MADDMFGDAALFDEFDKEREPSGSFILYEKDEQGDEDKSKIVFQFTDSSSSDDSDGDDGDEAKVASVAGVVKKLQKQNDKSSSTADTSGDGVSQNGVAKDSSDSSEDSSDDEPVVSKERLAKSTTYKLNFERNKFKRYCNIIDSTRYVQEEESPAVQVLFQNNHFSRKYKTQIETFVRHLLDVEAQQAQMGKYQAYQKLDLKNTTPSCTELNDKVPIAKRTDQMWRAHTIIGCSQFYNEFVLDALGWPLVEYNPSLTESWDIPVYEQVYEDILPMNEEEAKAAAKKQEKKEKYKSKCWNCDGDHMMTECKQPRNQQKINENRQIMMQQKQDQNKGPQGPKSARYHKEKSVTEEGKYRPGHISEGLREALGLGADQLPVYIYKMRALGYPPGWMEDAMTDPGLAMFDKDGNDMDEEAGAGAERSLNIEKIIEYPGFTVATPDNITDESAHYGMPPIQPHQLKAVLKQQTEMQKETLKRQQDEEEESSRKRQKIAVTDMELEEGETEDSNCSFAPPLPPETPPGKPPLPDSTPPATPRESPLPRQGSRETSEGRSDSPSLEELEAQYQQLQKSLQEGGAEGGVAEGGDMVVLDSCGDDSQLSTAPSTAPSNTSANPIELDSLDDDDQPVGESSRNPIPLDDSVIEDDDDIEFVKPRLNRVESTSSIQTFGELGTGSPFNSQPGTPLAGASDRPSFKGSVSMSKDFGTPILRRTGSIEYLPQDSKFAVGIEDHIPFENLPDSTGTFEKMRSLISKIRKKIPSRRKK